MVESVKITTKAPESKRESTVSHVRKTEPDQAVDSLVSHILHLQRTAGNQAVQRMIKSGAIQAKLTINQPGDVYEQEADRIADQVTTMPEPRLQQACSTYDEEEIVQTTPLCSQITPLVQRQVEPEEEQEEETPIQTKRANEGLVQRQDVKSEEDEEEKLQTKPLAGQISSLIQRQVKGEDEEKEEEETPLQFKAEFKQTPETPPSVRTSITALRGSGHPLPAPIRAFFEPRFGYDFSRVCVHTDGPVVETAHTLNARAFTCGQDVVFGADQYAPETNAGRRLLAHELTHVVQQGMAQEGKTLVSSDQSKPLALQRQTASGSGTTACSIPSGCPPDFCKPYPNRAVAIAARQMMASALLAGIAVKVSPRVVPLWFQYLFGGTPSQDLSGRFAQDFTHSATTRDTTDFLINTLRTNLENNPPSFPGSVNKVVVNLPDRISSAIAEIGDPNSTHQMDFNVIGEIPGNIAGGIGRDQLNCSVGARPSPFNDDRTATGTAEITRNPDGTLTVVPSIMYTVQDTIDLCPGNCGAKREQIATIPLSRMEASGISGDVPFTVTFPALPRIFTIRPQAPLPVPTTSGSGAIIGQTIASSLRIRQMPSSSSPILGEYPRGSTITILCQTTGTEEGGNSTWDRTDRGFVADRFVSRIGSGNPPDC